MSRLRCQNGFSLVELLIAMVVLAVVITSFTALLTSSFQGVFSAGHKSEAQYIGQDAMENLLADLTASHPDASVDINNDPLPINFDVGGSPISVTGTEVTVTIPYTDARGNPRTQVFKAFIPD